MIDMAVASSLGMHIADEGGYVGRGLVAVGKGGVASVRLGALRRALSLEPSIRGAASAKGRRARGPAK